METVFDFKEHEWDPGRQACSSCGLTFREAATTYAGYRCSGLKLGGMPVVTDSRLGPNEAFIIPRKWPKCECGGAAAGALPYAAGHSGWCPVAPK